MAGSSRESMNEPNNKGLEFMDEAFNEAREKELDLLRTEIRDLSGEIQQDVYWSK